MATDLTGLVGSPNLSATYAATTTPGSVAYDIIPSMFKSSANFKTASRSIILTL